MHDPASDSSVILPDAPSEISEVLREEDPPAALDEIVARAQRLPPTEAIEFLRSDQRQRWAHGAPIPAESYLEAAPTLANHEHFFDLIYSEFLLREERGESPTLEEYQQRFPQLAGQLRRQLELHAAVESSGVELMSHTAVDKLDSPAGMPGNRWPELAGYEIVTELGHGGMGVVYQAWQPSLRRYVAIKMLRAGETASAEALKRLRTEAEAVAALQHPNIVQIHEVGTHDGCPYLVLEYVRGGNLARLLQCGPQPARVAARFVATLARAVHHAHLQRIVHRDLKPANILLQPLGGRQEVTDLEHALPRITDFGLAKHLDLWADGPDLQTQTGQILGTPAYMAPEQAWGLRHGIGPTTDVYALGTILYELLAGRPPFQAASPLITVMLVRTEEPIPPSRLQPGLPRDLETICLKCLEKEPRKRYSSAADLAEDLERHERGEPIRARPIRLPHRLWRWCRRRPGIAGLLAGMVCVLVMAFFLVAGQWQRAEANLSAMTVQWTRAENLQRVAEERAAQLEAERTRAEGLQKEAERQQERAVKSLARTREVVDRFYLEITRDERMREPGLQELRKRLLTQARDYYEQFIAEGGDDPFTRNQMGRAAGWLARISGEIASKEEAIRYYQLALGIFEKLLKEVGANDPNRPRYRSNVAISYDSLGVLHAETGRAREALAYFREAIRAREELLKESLDPATRRRYEMGVAGSWSTIGNVQRGLGQYVEARRSLTFARDLQLRLSKVAPDDSGSLNGLVMTSLNLALLQRDQGQFRQAEENLNRARICAERLVAQFPREAAFHRLAAETYLESGVLQLRREGAPGWIGFREQVLCQLRGMLPGMRRFDPVACYEKAVASYAQAAELQPSTHHFKDDIAGTLNNLAVEFLKRGQHAEASPHLERALAIQEELVRTYGDVDDYRRDLGLIHDSLARLALDTGDLSAALIRFAQAQEQLAKLLRRTPGLPEPRAHQARVLLGVATVYTRQGNQEAAESSLRAALGHFRDLFRQAPTVQRHRNDLGSALADATILQLEGGRFARTLPLLEERERLWSATPLELLKVSADYALGATRLEQSGDQQQARLWSQKARATLASALAVQLRFLIGLRIPPSGPGH